MNTHPYYIDPECKTIEFEGISSHVGIARKIIEETPGLKDAFEKSKIKYPTDFLIEQKGYIQVTDDTGNGFYKRKFIFSASKMTPKQKRIVMQLIDDGFSYENRDAQSQDIVVRFHDFD